MKEICRIAIKMGTRTIFLKEECSSTDFFQAAALIKAPASLLLLIWGKTKVGL
jgi:hypothetical protein